MGLLIVAFFAVLLALRINSSGGRALSGGLALAFGVWLVWSAAVYRHALIMWRPIIAPRELLLLVGLWFIVKGALRATS
jgi:hypothetical protein